MNEGFTTHFKTQIMTTVIDNITNEMVLSELVRGNQPLVSLVANNSEELIHLNAGGNCCLSDEKDIITAGVSGYPIISQYKKNDASHVNVEIIPVIDVADDRMRATLTLYPGLPGVLPFELPDILVFCAERGIDWGIDELTIQETIEQVEKLQQPLEEIPIARGVLPVDGKDAYLRFEVEIGPLPGKILQDGSIDWRERKIFIGIDKDELIARKIPLTKGTPGVDIHGLAIPQKSGKDISVKVSGDVMYIEESRQVLATCSGVLSIVNETDIKVSAMQTIDGDVDFSVGNIESNDGLTIKGDVKPGFTINCRGDLSVGGNIQSATIRTKGNTKIAGGLIGEYTELFTDGDAEVSFIERGTINSGGTVVITKGAYYATVSAKRMLLCRPESKIVGGTLSTSDDFIGGNIGTDSAVATNIAVGVDQNRYYQLLKLRTSVAEIERELETLLHIQGKGYSENKLYKNKEAELDNFTQELRKLNLITGSPLNSGHDASFTYCPATITVLGRIVAGTKIRIGNIRTTLEEDTSAIRFYIDRKTGHIVATPYTEGKK